MARAFVGDGNLSRLLVGNTKLRELISSGLAGKDTGLFKHRCLGHYSTGRLRLPFSNGCVLFSLRRIHTLVISWCDQRIITDRAFENLRGIHTLNMALCTQTTITDKAFENLRGIHTLNISRCDQTTTTDKAFENLRGIHTLNIEGCYQTAITDNAFENLHGIHTLNMSCCDQSTITDKAFENLRRIHMLNMSCCGQTNITGRRSKTYVGYTLCSRRVAESLGMRDNLFAAWPLAICIVK